MFFRRGHSWGWQSINNDYVKIFFLFFHLILVLITFFKSKQTRHHNDLPEIFNKVLALFFIKNEPNATENISKSAFMVVFRSWFVHAWNVPVSYMCLCVQCSLCKTIWDWNAWCFLMCEKRFQAIHLHLHVEWKKKVFFCCI